MVLSPSPKGIIILSIKWKRIETKKTKKKNNHRIIINTSLFWNTTRVFVFFGSHQGIFSLRKSYMTTVWTQQQQQKNAREETRNWFFIFPHRNYIIFYYHYLFIVIAYPKNLDILPSRPSSQIARLSHAGTFGNTNNTSNKQTKNHSNK